MSWGLAESIAAGIAWVVAVVALLVTTPAQRTPRSLGVVVAAHAILVRFWVPNAPVHTNNHGVTRFADLRDMPALEMLETTFGFHGNGWWVPGRLLTPLLPDPFLLTLAYSAGAIWLTHRLARGLGASPQAAMLAAVVLATLPLQLRMAGTLTLYAGSEVGLLAAGVLWLDHLRDGRTATLLGAMAALVWTMMTHTEMLPVGPAFVAALLLTTQPRWLLALPRSPARLAAVTVGILWMVPRLHNFLSFAGPKPAPSVDWSTRLLVAGTLLGGFALWPAIARRLKLSARTLPAGAALGSALGLLVAVRATAHVWAHPPAVVGLTEPLAPPAHLLELHALFVPSVTPRLWLTVAVAGLAHLMWRRPEAARTMVALAVPVFLIFTLPPFSFEPATQLRSGLVAAPLLALAVGEGLHLWTLAVAQTTTPRLALHLTAALLLLTSLGHRVVFRHVFPEQAEFAVLRHAHEVAGQDTPVFTLLAEDTGDVQHPEHFAFSYYRNHVHDMLPQAQGLTALLADPDPTGAIVVLPLTCWRAVYAEIDGPEPASVVVAGRAFVDVPAPWPAAPTVRDVLTPCWYSDTPTCADSPACTRERCAVRSAPQANEPELIDPLCRQVRDRFTLTPLLTFDHLTGNLSSHNSRLLDPSATVGVYRIQGLREAPTPSETPDD